MCPVKTDNNCQNASINKDYMSKRDKIHVKVLDGLVWLMVEIVVVV